MQNIAIHKVIRATEPEFWFGDLVDFFWTDEKSGVYHSETGKVIGVSWDFTDKCWEYTVVWLFSTAYPSDTYPVYDGEKILARVICKHLKA